MAGNHEIRLKYGLAREPSDAEVTAWARRVRDLRERGYDLEDAGFEAAREIFNDFGRQIFASEAESIETLLRLAEEKK